MTIKNIDISKIVYNSKKRIRKDLGSLKSLKESILKHGLFYPPIVTKGLELLAGHRRIEAVKELGWREIPVLVVNVNSKKDKFEIEVEENVVRKEFTLSELEEMLKIKKELEEKNFFKKIINLFKRFFRWLKEKFG